MQKEIVKDDLFAGVEIGRDSGELCSLAKFFDGFANSTRLSILLILARRGETKGRGVGARAGGAAAASL